MRRFLSTALLRLAVWSLVDSRREWAAAMEAEFDAALHDGQELGFAWGCLLAAWRELLGHEEGRRLAAGHLLAAGVLVPVGALLALSALSGLPFIVADGGPVGALLGTGRPAFPITDANQLGIPLLCALTFALGGGHLLMAWFLLELDWRRVAQLGRLGAAIMTSLLIFSAILFLADLSALPQATVLAVELVAIWSLVRWHRELGQSACTAGGAPSG